MPCTQLLKATLVQIYGQQFRFYDKIIELAFRMSFSLVFSLAIRSLNRYFKEIKEIILYLKQSLDSG